MLAFNVSGSLDNFSAAISGTGNVSMIGPGSVKLAGQQHVHGQRHRYRQRNAQLRHRETRCPPAVAFSSRAAAPCWRHSGPSNTVAGWLGYINPASSGRWRADRRQRAENVNLSNSRPVELGGAATNVNYSGTIVPFKQHL